MKKIIYIASIFIGALSLGSCNDWLEMPSESKYDSETVFETVERAEMAVIGCYPSIFNRELYYQLGMGTEDCFSTEGETNSKNQVANYVYSTSNIPTSTYTSMYAAIEYSNMCIKKIGNMNAGSEKDRQKLDMLLGEAYAIRAMSFFNIVRFFGDVPYPTEPMEDAETFYSGRVSRDTIMNGCVADLQKAVSLLPWQSEAGVPTVERFNKNSAYGILARVALYAAGYSLRWDLQTYAPSSVKMAKMDNQARIQELYVIARDACKAVIDRQENDLIKYEDVFRNLVNGIYNKESMLEYGQYGSEVNGSSIGYTNGIYAHTSSIFGKSQPAMHSLATYWFDFDEGDLRREVAICNYGISADNIRQMNTYSSTTIGKFRVDWKKTIGTAINKRDINWPFLRFSDVLLMYAEAENEINKKPSQAAITAFERVRVRAFGGDKTKIGKTPSDYQAFLDAIIKERSLELGFEGLRRTDLVRWGILYEYLTHTKENLIDMANRTGQYANLDKYRAYKKEKATFDDGVTSVSYISYKDEPTDAQKEQLTNDGYTLLDMFGKTSLSFSNELKADAVWVTGLFRGLQKNKVELLPLNSNTIDVNVGLTGEQHPMY